MQKQKTYSNSIIPSLTIFLIFFCLALQNVIFFLGLTGLHIGVLIAFIFLFPKLAKLKYPFIDYYSIAVLIASFLFLISFSMSAIHHKDFSSIITLLFPLSMVFICSFSDLRSFSYGITGIYMMGLLLIIISTSQFIGLIPEFEFTKISRVNFDEGGFALGYTGLIPSRGSYGILLCIFLSINLMLFDAHNNKLKKFIFLLITLLIIFTASISLSRSTYLAIGILLVGYFLGRLFFGNKSFFTGGVKFFSFFLVIAISILILFLSGIASRFINILISMRSASVDARVYTFKDSLESFLQNPIFGISGNYTEVSGHVIHNAFIAVLVESGVLTAIMFICLNLLIFYRLTILIISKNTTVAKCSLAVLCGFSGGLFEMLFFRGFMSPSYWGLVAFIIVYFRTVGIPNLLQNEMRSFVYRRPQGFKIKI